MHNALRNHKALPRNKLDDTSFQIDQKAPFKDVKKLVIIIVLVPVVFPLENPHPDDGIIYFAERLVKHLYVQASAMAFSSIVSKGPNAILRRVS